MLSGDLREAKAALAEKQAALSALGEPMVGNTVAEYGLQQGMQEKPSPVPPFVQVDLGESMRFETVALIPAVVDFQGVNRSAYAFPLRFRLDASDDAQFGTFTALLEQTDADFTLGGFGPLVIHAPGSKARYLRLTVTKQAREEGRWTFAMSELMVLDGNANIALGCAVTHRGSTELSPRWAAQNLTDGRTSLGPPIDRSSVPEFDGVFATIDPDVPQPWLCVDLGKALAVDEVRLHPLHARQGADVPGYAFPRRFRVETAMKEDFSDAAVIFAAVEADFPIPGNNPVTVRAKGQIARFVRVVMTALQEPRRAFALSELEVYAGGVNASRGCVVTSSGDTYQARKSQPRPLSLLTDGHTSYGRLMELPDWFRHWEHRLTLQQEVRSLTAQVEKLAAMAERRALWMLAGALALMSAGVGLLFWRSHQRSKQAQVELRSQLARDMHDEIGSNLAGIAVISEASALQAGASAQDLLEINRIAHETADAMREVLWLVGARQESGIDLMEHLELVAKRLLPNHEVEWQHTAQTLPASWPIESRRQVFLFFKEAITNILRHAKATHVELSAKVSDTTFEMSIYDNGCGFDTVAPSRGMGLESLRQRAKVIGGSMTMQSSAEHGTTLTLRVPLPR